MRRCKKKSSRPLFFSLHIAAATTLILVAPSCRPDVDGRKAVYTYNWLRDLYDMVQFTVEGAGEPPPISEEEFWAWCAQKERDGDLGGNPIATGGAMLGKDAWGNDVRILIAEQKIVGLASAGPNGQWDDLQGDDIVIPREKKGG